MAEVKCRDILLLTGAGFTKNFGGYLASEMWARIFSHSAVQGTERVRECMLNQLNFENAYAAVMDTGNYTGEEKIAFTEALRSAFSHMHERIFSAMAYNRDPSWDIFDILIKPFFGRGDECGLFFTLNQDLCTEVAYSHSMSDPNSEMDLLGIARDAWFRNAILETIEREPIFLPDQSTVEKIRADFSRGNVAKFLYIKLHGSYGWKKKDGSDAMVLGNIKSKAISKEPLLNWYHDLFQQTLLNKGQRLLVIGYSFRDPHINKSIACGVRDAGLKLFVVNPASSAHVNF